MKPMDHQEPDRTNEPDSAFLLRPKIEEAEKDAMTSEDRLEQPKEIQEATEEKTYETRNGGENKKSH